MKEKDQMTGMAETYHARLGRDQKVRKKLGTFTKFTAFASSSLRKVLLEWTTSARVSLPTFALVEACLLGLPKPRAVQPSGGGSPCFLPSFQWVGIFGECPNKRNGPGPKTGAVTCTPDCYCFRWSRLPVVLKSSEWLVMSPPLEKAAQWKWGLAPLQGVREVLFEQLV